MTIPRYQPTLCEEMPRAINHYDDPQGIQWLVHLWQNPNIKDVKTDSGTLTFITYPHKVERRTSDPLKPVAITFRD